MRRGCRWFVKCTATFEATGVAESAGRFDNLPSKSGCRGLDLSLLAIQMIQTCCSRRWNLKPSRF